MDALELDEFISTVSSYDEFQLTISTVASNQRMNPFISFIPNTKKVLHVNYRILSSRQWCLQTVSLIFVVKRTQRSPFNAHISQQDLALFSIRDFGNLFTLQTYQIAQVISIILDVK